MDDRKNTILREGQKHVASSLTRESLMDRDVISRTTVPIQRILPNLNVVQIGGMSIMNRGKDAILPLIDEIVRNQKDHIQAVGVGPWVRARHVISIGFGLACPRGRCNPVIEIGSAVRLYGFLPFGEARLCLSGGPYHRATFTRDPRLCP